MIGRSLALNKEGVLSSCFHEGDSLVKLRVSADLRSVCEAEKQSEKGLPITDRFDNRMREEHCLLWEED